MARLIYKITNLVVKRGSSNDGNSVEASWGLSGGTDWGYDGWYDEIWTFNASKNMSSKVTQQPGAGPATGDIVWTRNGDGLHMSAYCYYNRAKYHPLTNGRYLTSVKCDVYHDNQPFSKGKYTHTAMTYAFQLPRQPEISAPSYDTQTGKVSFTIATDQGKDERERYDTMYCITRQDSSDRSDGYSYEQTVVPWASSTATSSTVEYDMSAASAVTPGQWVRVTCKAYARGLRGDSPVSESTYVYAFPAQAAIKSITASNITSAGVITVALATNAWEYEPVDSIKLQRLADVEYATAAAAGLASGWADVSGATDNGLCTGLADTVASAIPSVKKHTWYRIVSTHGNLTRYSTPVEAVCLYRDKDAVADDKVKFGSLASGSDGESVVALIGWKNDDSNGTEIAWSKHEDAWESTEQPSIYDVTWEDSTSQITDWAHSAHVTIRWLEEGVPCYVRARRKLTTASSTSYGPWATPAKELYPVTPSVMPSSVVLNAPATVVRGSGIDCSWTYNGSQQTAWQLFMVVSNVRKLLRSGVGALGSTTIPAEMFEGMDSLNLGVAVTCGGNWAESALVPVTVTDAPELAVAVSEELGEQPLEIGLACTSNDATVKVYVTSRGVSTVTPSGSRLQAQGDIVWSDTVTPDWVLDDDVWVATIEAPNGLELYQGATYDVSAVATDRATSLASAEAVGEFDVDWDHRAQRPDPATTIEVDSDLLHATITPVADSGAALTDVCDVYRLTPDGAYLIAEDVPFGTPVTDRYAPYAMSGETSYRLCTRTADGDIAWDDYEYALRHAGLRVDWDRSYVELPYNVTVSDSWEKNFELREHMDGTQAGYWDEGATRTGTLSTDVMKVDMAETSSLLRDLAAYAGECFVRTSDGLAYQANVSVETFGVSYNSAVVPVSISATEVALGPSFSIAPGDWDTEEPATTTTTTTTTGGESS